MKAREIDLLNYEKGKLEILFLVLSNAVGFKKITGVPLVKVIYTIWPWVEIQNALGDIIVLTTGLGKNDLNFLKSFNADVYLSKNVLAVKREFIKDLIFPVDLVCGWSNIILSAMVNGKKIDGDILRLNKTEILRFVYRHKEFSLKQKLFLLWRLIK